MPGLDDQAVFHQEDGCAQRDQDDGGGSHDRGRSGMQHGADGAGAGFAGVVVDVGHLDDGEQGQEQ